MVNGLRKVDFSQPTGHYTWKKIPPLRKSWVRPWMCNCNPRRASDATLPCHLIYLAHCFIRLALNAVHILPEYDVQAIITRLLQ